MTDGAAFRAYDWTPIDKPDHTHFFFAPNYVEYFESSEGDANLVYGSYDGRIRRKIFTETGYNELSLWAITE